MPTSAVPVMRPEHGPGWDAQGAERLHSGSRKAETDAHIQSLTTLTYANDHVPYIPLRQTRDTRCPEIQNNPNSFTSRGMQLYSVAPSEFTHIFTLE